MARRYLGLLLCALGVRQDLSMFLHIYDPLPHVECQEGIRAARVLRTNSHAITRCVQIAIILPECFGRSVWLCSISESHTRQPLFIGQSGTHGKCMHLTIRTYDGIGAQSTFHFSENSHLFNCILCMCLSLVGTYPRSENCEGILMHTDEITSDMTCSA